MSDWVSIFLSGGTAVAVITGLKEIWIWHKNRKAKKEDKAEEKADDEKKIAALKIDERLKEIERQNDVQREAMKYILYDRIRFLGQAYIAEGEIDFDDRRILHNMHNIYHNGLEGNGDLDELMQDVDALPLKVKKKYESRS